MYGTKLTKSKQFNQSLNVLSSMGGGRGKATSSSSAGIHQNTSTSKSRRGQKQQSKHSSLEKFNTALLYGTQNIPSVNQQFYMGTALGSGHLSQQLTGPQLQIKMQGTTKNQQIKKTNNGYNIINVNSFTPDRLKSR